MGIHYYGYRYYHPELGRWLSRDPIQENGGKNLYAFARNQPPSGNDLFGLLTKSEACTNAANAAIQKKPTLSRLREIVNGKTTVSVACECHDKVGKVNAETFPPKSAKNTSLYTVIKIYICCQDGEDFDGNYKFGFDDTTLLHELVHARDFSEGWLKNDCDSLVCSELKAYAAVEKYKNPSLYDQSLKNGRLRKYVSEQASDSAASKCGSKEEAFLKAFQLFEQCVGNHNVI